MNRVEWCACNSVALNPPIKDSVALPENRLTYTWKMFSTSEMGTFSEPKLRDLAVVRVLAIFVKAVVPFIIGIYSRECFLTDGTAEHNVGRRKLKANALLRS